MEKNIDNFYNDFKFANTVDEKIKLLESFISGNDISDDDLKELQLQINDVIEQNAIEEDLIISMEIEDSKYKLHTCVNEYYPYNKGVNYYIKIDDPKEFYQNTGIGETNTLIQNMIDSIKPIYYIVVDDGIGTLKRKNILPKDIEFSKHFTKFA